MRDRLLNAIPMVGIVAVSCGIVLSLATASDRTPAASTPFKTPWGDPDLQGIWTDETTTPLQRSPKYANQEFFTDAQRAELDRQRSAMSGRDARAERGTEADVAGAHN